MDQQVRAGDSQSLHPQPKTRGAGPDLQTLFANVGSRRWFEKGQLLGILGQPCTAVQIIIRGQVLLCATVGSEEQALDLLGVGDLVGEGCLQPERRWTATARAVTDTVVQELPAAAFPRLCQYYPDFTLHLLALLSGRVERGYRRPDLANTSNAPERLMTHLIKMADQHGERRGDEVWLSLPVTQAELAAMVGITRETVVRAFAKLEAQGAIRRVGRRGLWLRQRTARPRADLEPGAPRRG